MIKRDHKSRRLFIAMLMITGALPTIFGSPVASASFPGENGRIAYDSNRDGNDEIYVVNDSTGSVPENLTDNSASDTDPAWSPNGRKIAFVSNRDGRNDIFVMNFDGSGATNLTHGATDGGIEGLNPTWSPDGRKIVFSCYNSFSDSCGLYSMNPDDGSGRMRLTSSRDFDPTWSPARGDWRIVFERGEDIYATNSSGTSLDTIIDNLATDTEPDWAPDGRLIAFTSDRVDSRKDIFLTNPTGSIEPYRSTMGRADDYSPDWSPNRRKLVFVKHNRELDSRYIMTAFTNGEDGTSGQSELVSVNDSYSVNNPDWQPLTVSDEPPGPGAGDRPPAPTPPREPDHSDQPPSPSATPSDNIAPLGTKFNVSRRVRRNRPVRINLTLSEPATLTFTFHKLERRCSARKGGSRRVNRRGCALTRRIGALTRTGVQGQNKLAFNGRRLARGNYRVVLKATDAAGNVSKPKSKKFKVV